MRTIASIGLADYHVGGLQITKHLENWDENFLGFLAISGFTLNRQGNARDPLIQRQTLNLGRQDLVAITHFVQHIRNRTRIDHREASAQVVYISFARIRIVCHLRRPHRLN